MGKVKTFKIIAAVDDTSGIGLGGTIPWHIPEDLRHFSKLTKKTVGSDVQNAVIMGRVTYESIPKGYRPLPMRTNAVITRQSSLDVEGLLTFNSLKEAIDELQNEVENVYVIGGAQIYKAALRMNQCIELNITHVSGDYGCDVFFPPYKDRYHLVESIVKHTKSGLRYTFSRWRQNENM